MQIKDVPPSVPPAQPGGACALRVQAFIEAAAADVMRRMSRVLRAGPLSHDEARGRRVADPVVHIR
jgi:hypothetical protein